MIAFPLTREYIGERESGRGRERWIEASRCSPFSPSRRAILTDNASFVTVTEVERSARRHPGKMERGESRAKKKGAVGGRKEGSLYLKVSEKRVAGNRREFTRRANEARANAGSLSNDTFKNNQSG